MAIIAEQINKMLAVRNATKDLWDNGTGFIAVDGTDDSIQVFMDVLLQIPGEIQASGFLLKPDGRWYKYSKTFGGVRFYALSREQVGSQVDVRA